VASPDGDPDEHFVITRVNCEGGPAMVGYHFVGPKLKQSLPPSHSLEGPFCFSFGPSIVNVRVEVEEKAAAAGGPETSTEIEEETR
jgi:hypothetical protein